MDLSTRYAQLQEAARKAREAEAEERDLLRQIVHATLAGEHGPYDLVEIRKEGARWVVVLSTKTRLLDAYAPMSAPARESLEDATIIAPSSTAAEATTETIGPAETLDLDAVSYVPAETEQPAEEHLAVGMEVDEHVGDAAMMKSKAEASGDKSVPSELARAFEEVERSTLVEEISGIEEDAPDREAELEEEPEPDLASVLRELHTPKKGDARDEEGPVITGELLVPSILDTFPSSPESISDREDEMPAPTTPPDGSEREEGVLPTPPTIAPVSEPARQEASASASRTAVSATASLAPPAPPTSAAIANPLLEPSNSKTSRKRGALADLLQDLDESLRVESVGKFENPFLQAATDPESRALRLARTLVGDIIAYKTKEHREALAAGPDAILRQFAEDIDRARTEYLRHVDADAISDPEALFRTALNDILCNGDQVF